MEELIATIAVVARRAAQPGPQPAAGARGDDADDGGDAEQGAARPVFAVELRPGTTSQHVPGVVCLAALLAELT